MSKNSIVHFGSRRNKSCPRQPAKNSSARNQIRNPPDPNPASTNATTHNTHRGRGEAADHQVVEVDLTMEEGGTEAGGPSSSRSRPPPPPYCVAAQSNTQSSQAALNFAQVRHLLYSMVLDCAHGQNNK